jgi:hypothetical protein
MVENIKDVLKRRQEDADFIAEIVSGKFDKVAEAKKPEKPVVKVEETFDKTAAADNFFTKLKDGSLSEEETAEVKIASNKALKGFFSLLHRR